MRERKEEKGGKVKIKRMKGKVMWEEGEGMGWM